MISVVIPSHNRVQKLVLLLESLEGQTHKNFEIIVVSDSTDGTEEMVKRFSKTRGIKTRFFRKKSDGPSQKRNVGIKNARGDMVAFIDDDCIADRDWLKNIDKSFLEGAGGVEGKTTTDKKIGPFSHYILNETGGQYMTCNMAYKKKVLNEVGAFDENFTTHVAINREDSDLAFSLMERGYKIVFSKGAVVRHPVAGASFMNRLKKKKEFFVDPLLFKKHKKLYIERIRYPFEMFTPLYVLSVLLSFVSPAFLVFLPLIAAVELRYRRWNASITEFLKFIILQVIGSFVVVIFYIHGCVNFRVNPVKPVFHL